MTGFTLIEILLVMVIVSMIIVMGVNFIEQRTLAMRIDRASTQMQQILNAALAYYVANGHWPADLACLQTDPPDTTTGCGSFLPSNLNIVSPWGLPYEVAPAPTTPSSLFYVYTPITYATASGQAAAVANTIAGKLPLSYVTSDTTGTPPDNDGTCQPGATDLTCNVVASVNIPGQNLNNASAINFAGIYHNGACVPVPTCPVDQNGIPMTAEIMVAPAGVSGVNDAPTNQGQAGCTNDDTSQCEVAVYPISSFAANAKDPATATASGGPASCDGSQTSAVCVADDTGTTIQDNNKYWRVCLSTITERGAVTPTTSPWGQLEGTIIAVTRCAINNESSGSGFHVWSN